MKRLCLMAAAILICALAFGPPAMAVKLEPAVVTGVYTLRSVVQIDPSQFLERPEQTWVLAKILPSPNSGVPTIPGGMTMEPGKPIHMGVPYREIQGSLVLLETLTKSPKTIPLTYRWQTSFHPTWQSMEDEQIFIRGGTGICRVNFKAQGAQRLSPAYLIPSDWARFVRPAIAFWKLHSSLFRPELLSDNSTASAKSDALKLTRLLNDKNPFIVITAWHTLVLCGNIDIAVFGRVLSQSEGVKQAALAYLLLTAPASSPKEVIEQILLGGIDQARTSAQILGLGLGTYVASDLQDGGMKDQRILSLCIDVLKSLDKKQRLLHTDTAVDRQLINIFEATGFREVTS